MGTTFVKLTKTHDVKGFDSGNSDLNNWFATVASQHQRKRLSVTTVLVDQSAPRSVIGFHTIAIRGLLRKEDFPSELVKGLAHRIPCFTIARLAVSVQHQGQGNGAMLLIDALDRVKQVAKEVGGVVVFVDAKDEPTARFYRKYGFLPLADAPTTLVLLVSDIPISLVWPPSARRSPRMRRRPARRG